MIWNVLGAIGCLFLAIVGFCGVTQTYPLRDFWFVIASLVNIGFALEFYAKSKKNKLRNREK